MQAGSLELLDRQVPLQGGCVVRSGCPLEQAEIMTTVGKKGKCRHLSGMQDGLAEAAGHWGCSRDPSRVSKGLIAPEIRVLVADAPGCVCVFPLLCHQIIYK